jgi:hypothetical protein
MRQSRHPIVVIVVINPPKQRQHNIQHRSTKLRLIVFVQGFDAAEDTARPALRGFRGKRSGDFGAGWMSVDVEIGGALWREKLM